LFDGSEMADLGRRTQTTPIVHLMKRRQLVYAAAVRLTELVAYGVRLLVESAQPVLVEVDDSPSPLP
jgi:hypothetical protein